MGLVKFFPYLVMERIQFQEGSRDGLRASYVSSSIILRTQHGWGRGIIFCESKLFLDREL